MNREHFLLRLEQDQEWDLVVIGGGASGIGSAIEAATRGLKTLLLEQHDFSKGTSSRSTKLVHGGVRYLAQGNISLVLEALRERGRLRKNAPHLVKQQAFIIPNYNLWGVPFYTIGLTIYDLMAGKWRFGSSRPHSASKTLAKASTLIKHNLVGGVLYYDGQFDDSRLAVNMVQTFCEHGGTALNYVKVVGLLKDNSGINGVEAVDAETGNRYLIKAKAVLNATGIFVDQILKMDDPASRDMVRPSQGVHLVVDKKFLPGDCAVMIPKTSDGRVFFAVPWHNKVVLGTTDVKKDAIELEPQALDAEVNFILETASQFLELPPLRSDVRSVFAGLRPLAAPTGTSKKTKEISRGHVIKVSPSGLVSLIGGKWTTYRQMGEDTINRIAEVHQLSIKPSVTADMRIHGYKELGNSSSPRDFYGADQDLLENLIAEYPSLADALGVDLGMIKAQVVLAVRNEMARTVEDVLARRTRALFLDAKQSIAIAPEVARIMAGELDKDEDWQKQQVDEYSILANRYLLS